MLETLPDPNAQGETGQMEPIDDMEPPSPREPGPRLPHRLPSMPPDPSKTGIMRIISELPDDDVRDDDTPEAPDES